MEHRHLGRSGVSVSNLCLGAMMFGDWGTKDHVDSIRIIHRALDGGINFIDTADIYSAGESEEIVGKALAGGRRDDIVLASKAHMPIGSDPNQRGYSRRWIVTEVENSLRRLQTDWIDLYQIHRPDPNTDIDETLGALSDLVHQGKIRYFGHSTFPVSEIVEAQWTAERRGRERFQLDPPDPGLHRRRDRQRHGQRAAGIDRGRGRPAAGCRHGERYQYDLPPDRYRHFGGSARLDLRDEPERRHPRNTRRPLRECPQRA